MTTLTYDTSLFGISGSVGQHYFSDDFQWLLCINIVSMCLFILLSCKLCCCSGIQYSDSSDVITVCYSRLSPAHGTHLVSLHTAMVLTSRAVSGPPHKVASTVAFSIRFCINHARPLVSKPFCYDTVPVRTCTCVHALCVDREMEAEHTPAMQHII